MKRLKDRLQIEFKKQDRSGVYGFTQRSMAYNSNRIEGSTLTEKQTASMFEKQELYMDDPEYMIFFEQRYRRNEMVISKCLIK